MSGPLDPPTIHQTYITRARQFVQERRTDHPDIQHCLTRVEASLGVNAWQAYRAGAGEVIIEQLLEVIDTLRGGTDGAA